MAKPQQKRHIGPAACLIPFAFPFLILLCGALFTGTNGTADAKLQLVGQTFVVGLILLQFVLCFLFSRRNEHSSAIVGIWIFAGYLSLIAAFVSMMSITDTWL